jgi:hypothetical protein
MSSRRLSVLVSHLPRDSAVGRELHGEAAEWSVGDHLLAAAVDHLAAANWMFACVNTAEDADQPDPPEPVPRPQDGGLAPAVAGPTASGAGAGYGAGSPAAADEGAGPGQPTRSELAGFFS